MKHYYDEYLNFVESIDEVQLSQDTIFATTEIAPDLDNYPTKDYHIKFSLENQGWIYTFKGGELYLYDAEFNYIGTIFKVEGIQHFNATELKPDLETYPIEDYIVKFNVDTQQWTYKDRNAEPEVEPEFVTPERLQLQIDDKHKRIGKLHKNKTTYDELVRTLRLLTPVFDNQDETYKEKLQDLTEKRLNASKEITTLEQELQELYDEVENERQNFHRQN